MLERTTVEYRGKMYAVELDRGWTADSTTGARTQPRWHVTIGGTAVTSFDAEPDETEGSVQDRVRGWLERHPDLHDRDQIHLGGG